MTVLLSTVITSSLGGYLVWKSYQALRSQAEQGQLELAKILASEADEDISRIFEQILLLSKRSWAMNLEKKTMVKELSQDVIDSGMTDAYLFLRPDEKIFARSYSALGVMGMPDQKFFHEVLKKEKKLKGLVSIDLYETGFQDRGMVVSTPVFRGSQWLGVLAGIIYLPKHDIGDLQMVRIGKSGSAYLVNQDGIGVIHPNRAKWLKDLSSSPPVAALKKQKEGIVQFTSGSGKEILAAFATIPICSWGIVIRQPAEECYAPAFDMLVFMSFFLAIAILVSIFLALTFSKRIVRPILDLATQVRRYESGEVNYRVLEEIKPRDEVGILKHALSRMAHTIETQAKEREKAYARTLEAEKRLSESERLATLGQFSAGLAHELNNPLAVILGSAEMARNAKGSKLCDWLDEIYREGDRCRRIVSDLLNFAKPLQLKIKNIDLVTLIRETWDQIESKKETHRLNTTSAHFHVWGDWDRFKQVFINLFKNAIEAMPAGGEVSVELKKMKGYYVVTIKDEGKGILKKNISKLFRPFFTTKSGGTGLGLAIIRSILQAHQGNLSLESNRPRGVKITLRWPQNLKPIKGKT